MQEVKISDPETRAALLVTACGSGSVVTPLIPGAQLAYRVSTRSQMEKFLTTLRRADARQPFSDRDLLSKLEHCVRVDITRYADGTLWLKAI